MSYVLEMTVLLSLGLNLYPVYTIKQTSSKHQVDLMEPRLLA